MNKMIYIVFIVIVVIVGLILLLNKVNQNVDNKAVIKHVSMDDIAEIMDKMMII